MTAEPSEVLRAGMELSPADREDVALRLFDSVDSAVDQSEVDAAWDAEIAERVEDIRSGKVKMMT